MKKKVFFLGYLVSPEEANVASGASVAGNKMQWNVVKHLAEYDDMDVECISITPYAAFPHDKMLFQREEHQMLNHHIPCLRVGYCNLPVLKQLWQVIAVYGAARRALKRHPDATVMCYNLFFQIGQPMRWIKKRFPKAQTLCLLADLPIDDKTDRKGLSKLLRAMFDRNTRNNLQCCDRYIVLNKHVADAYLPGKPYIVIDGGVDEDDIPKSLQQEKKPPVEKNILFCGALTEYNGVSRLIEAMEHFRGTDIYCDIYGGGYLEDQVRQAAQQNPNLRFHGRVDNATVMQKQREAWLLINPRIVDDPIAQVTFPSKTFEYLLSGTPVLSTRLNGYSNEYDDLMFFADDDTPDGIVRAIERANTVGAEQMHAMAERAIAFVVNRRRWAVQTDKLKHGCL